MTWSDLELPPFAADLEMAPIIDAMRKVASGVVASASIPVSHLVTTSDNRANLEFRLVILSGILKVKAHLVAPTGRPRTGKVTIQRRK
jgi:hypothetical protein